MRVELRECHEPKRTLHEIAHFRPLLFRALEHLKCGLGWAPAQVAVA